MSKQPVMEALRRLSGDGLIEIVPQVGSRVATFAPHEVSDFYLMFGGFEGTIAGIAALRRTERQLDELELISARIEALRSSPDAVERAHGYRVLNRDFHHAIHDMAHSRIMADTSRRMWDLSDFLINTCGVPQPLSSALDDRHADHERIRAALHAGDQETARAEMGAAHRRHRRRHPRGSRRGARRGLTNPSSFLSRGSCRMAARRWIHRAGVRIVPGGVRRGRHDDQRRPVRRRLRPQAGAAARPRTTTAAS